MFWFGSAPYPTDTLHEQLRLQQGGVGGGGLDSVVDKTGANGAGMDQTGVELAALPAASRSGRAPRAAWS